MSNLFDLLGFICDSMSGMVLLMRNMDHEAECPDSPCNCLVRVWKGISTCCNTREVIVATNGV